MDKKHNILWLAVFLVMAVFLYVGCSGSQNTTQEGGKTRLYHASLDTVISSARDAASDAAFDVQGGVWNNDSKFTFTMVKRNLAQNADGAIQTYQFHLIVQNKGDNTVLVTYDEGPHDLGYSVTVDPSIGFRRQYFAALDSRMRKIAGAVQ